MFVTIVSFILALQPDYVTTTSGWRHGNNTCMVLNAAQKAV